MEEALTLARITEAQGSSNEADMQTLLDDVEAFLTALLSAAPQQATEALGRIGFVPNP